MEETAALGTRTPSHLLGTPTRRRTGDIDYSRASGRVSPSGAPPGGRGSGVRPRLEVRSQHRRAARLKRPSIPASVCFVSANDGRLERVWTLQYGLSRVRWGEQSQVSNDDRVPLFETVRHIEEDLRALERGAKPEHLYKDRCLYV
jgi:hypothetical protein